MHIEEEIYKKLTQENNNTATNYLLEIIFLETENLYLWTNYTVKEQRRLEKQLKQTKKKENEIIVDYLVLVRDLIYRYYSLLEKIAQFINGVWLKEFKENECSFIKVKKEQKT